MSALLNIAAANAGSTWTDGLLPLERPASLGNDSAFTITVVVIMLAMCVSFNTIQRIWGTLIKHLWSTRIREGFENITGKERRVIGLLLLVAIFFIGLVAGAGLAAFQPSVFTLTFQTVAKLTAFVTGYFIFQYLIYTTIGFSFTDDDGRRLWVEGFTAAMSLLGITLLVPALIVLLYPDFTVFAVIFSVLLYFLARFMFICKGFRIFYTNFGSLVYFILYLCSLEIIPLTILYFLARNFCAV